MKKNIRTAIVLTFLVFLTGCASSLPSVKLKSDQPPGKPLDATAVTYTNTYFQERFMGLKPLLVGPMLWYVAGSYEGRRGQRLQSGDFEKLLGEFDVFEYFNEQLKMRASDSSTIKLKFSDSQQQDLALQVLELARCARKDDCGPAVKSLSEKTPYIAAFKMSYGLGSKQGAEQFGFRKYYRPFIRIIGIVKNIPLVEVIWQSDILVFGDKRYLGGDADADRIPKDELVSSFKMLTTQSIDLLVRNLNGEMLQEMPILVDNSASDLSF